MLKILFGCNDQSAIFKLPYHYLEVEKFLLSAGFRESAIDLTLLDNDDPGQVQIKVITEDTADFYLLSLFPDDIKLSTVNTVCDLFYQLPAEQQGNMMYDVTLGKITDYKNLLNTIKEIKAAESPHDLPAIVFSRIRLWTDEGEECEFFMGGVPESYDDIEDQEDFEDFVQQISTTNTKDITAYITTFTEGNAFEKGVGEMKPAEKTDIDRIYTAIADVDIDTITAWNWFSENSFTFDYDIDELFNMKSGNAEEESNLDYNSMIEKIMPEVESGSDDPITIWRENGGWNLEYAVGEGKSTAIRKKDPSAITVTGADFAKGSYPYVFDKILTMRFRAEYDLIPPDTPHRTELAELLDILEDNMGELSSEAAEHLASLDNPLAEVFANITENLKDGMNGDIFGLIENMGDTTEQPGMTGIE